MAKDYFEDVFPPQDSAPRPSPPPLAPLPSGESTGGEKSIRNIAVNTRRRERIGADMRVPPSPPSLYPRATPPSPPRGGRRIWIWIGAVVSLIVLVVLGLFAFRASSIQVTPTTRPAAFDENVRFTVAPSVDSGALHYTVASNEFEESAVVPGSGTETVSEKARGTVTLYNSYSSTPVRLIKNTRLEGPQGLIFRVPNEVVIPGKRGQEPGTLSTQVIADAAGEKYNIAPVERFTLPGLKSSPDMYAGVYARSQAGMSGGFEGARPAVAPSALESAKAQMRARLEEKAREASATAASDGAVVFPELSIVSYESLPLAPEAGGGVRIREKARVSTPVFPREMLASAAASLLGIDTAGSPVLLKDLGTVSAAYVGASPPSELVEPITFTLRGNATLVWQVDRSALAKALAGKNESQFEAIIAGFPSIAEARARIQPFWKSSFPDDPARIRISVSEGGK